MLIGSLNPPTIVTMLGLLSGFLACWLGVSGKAELAVVALIWAGIFDLFDGMVARRCHLSAKESEFGIHIDTVVDMVSFGIAPVMVAFGLGMNSLFGALSSAFYVCAAAQRLAYFNAQQVEAKGNLKTYTGLPVTFAALIFGVLFSGKYFMSAELFDAFSSILFVVVGILFISKIQIPKPEKKVYLLMPLLACMFSVYWIVKAGGANHV